MAGDAACTHRFMELKLVLNARGGGENGHTIVVLDTDVKERTYPAVAVVEVQTNGYAFAHADRGSRQTILRS